jgi:hypothetical protein
VSPARGSTDLSGVVASSSTELSAFTATSVDLETDFDGETVGFCSADGVLDVGETGTLSVTIANGGTDALSGLTAQVTVLGDADVTLENDGLITFGELAPFSSATSTPIQVTVNSAEIAENIAFEVTFPERVEGDETIEPAPVFTQTQINFSFEKVAPVGGVATDDMEDNSTAADWTQNTMVGGDAAGGFIYDSINTPFFQGNNPFTNLGQRTLRLLDNGFETDVAYETTEMEVGYAENFTVSFWHSYLFETGFDGGVVELSVNGSEWRDVTEFGGQFQFGGYNAVLDANLEAQALAGRAVFTGRNFAPANGGAEVIDFGSALNGNMVKFRFRIATDFAVGDFGWFIDNVTFTNVATPVYSAVVTGETTACDNSLPRLADVASVTVDERATATLTASAADRNADDVLSYSWTQTSGLSVAMQGADTATMSFAAPSVSANSTLGFTVTVSDGTDAVSTSTTVNINNLPDPVTEAPSTRSSGSMGWIALLLAPIAFIRRRRFFK